VAVVLGGRSVTWGTLAGAAAYSVLNAETTSLPGLSDLLLGVMLVVVLGYLPSGLTGITVPGRLLRDPGRPPAKEGTPGPPAPILHSRRR